MQQTRELMMGELVIGASDTVTRSLLLPYLQRFHERYPAIRLKVLNGTSYEALQMLRAGQVDLAFASTPQESGNLQMRRCMALHNVFVAGRDCWSANPAQDGTWNAFLPAMALRLNRR